MRPPTAKALARQAEQLRNELLENLLQTTQTFIELTELEVRAENKGHSMEGIDHIQRGLKTIRKIVTDVASRPRQARISKRLAQLEQRAARLTAEFEGQKH